MAAGDSRPVLFLDIDGVLLPFGNGLAHERFPDPCLAALSHLLVRAQAAVVAGIHRRSFFWRGRPLRLALKRGTRARQGAGAPRPIGWHADSCGARRCVSRAHRLSQPSSNCAPARIVSEPSSNCAPARNGSCETGAVRQEHHSACLRQRDVAIPPPLLARPPPLLLQAETGARIVLSSTWRALDAAQAQTRRLRMHTAILPPQTRRSKVHTVIRPPQTCRLRMHTAIRTPHRRRHAA